MADPKPKLRWCQYRLWHLFAITLVVVIVCACVASYWKWYLGPKRIREQACETANRRGSACIRNGEYDKAIAAFDEAIRLNPQDVEAYTGRAYAHAEKGEYDKAADNFTEAVRLGASHALSFLAQALVHFEKGQYDKAWADMEAYRQGKPVCEIPSKFLAELRKASGREK